MGWFVVIILVILLIVLLIGLAGAVIQVGVASLPAWGIGLSIGLMVFYALRQKIIRSIRTPENLAGLVTLTFDGRTLNCSINHSEVDKYADSSEPISLAVLICVTVTVGILVYLANQTQVFVGHKFLDDRMSETASIVFAVIISAIIVSYTFAKVKQTETFRVQIRENVERLVASANLSLKATDDLQSLIQKNASFASKLKIAFPDQHTPAIRSYVERNKATLLIDTSGVNRILNSEISKAKEDHTNLERSARFFDEVMQLYFRTASEVNRAGSTSMIYLLDQLLKGIEGLKELVPRREWKKFYDGIEFAKGELSLLCKNAARFAEAPQSEPEDQDLESDDPYSVLGVTKEMTDAQIKQVYRHLCNIYHPDKRLVVDDSKFKDIQEAYEKIEKLRNL